jgi:hypothetical protein
MVDNYCPTMDAFNAPKIVARRMAFKGKQDLLLLQGDQRKPFATAATVPHHTPEAIDSDSETGELGRGMEIVEFRLDCLPTGSFGDYRRRRMTNMQGG